MAESDQEKPRILVGCVAGDESELPKGIELHNHRDPGLPARVERTPVVIDDPGEIDRTQAIFEQGIAELYDVAIAKISRGEWVFMEHDLALKLRRDKAIADLQAITEDERHPPAARAKAAEKLAVLNVVAGEGFLFETLKSASPEMRLAALGSLREWGLRIDFTKADWAGRILSLLDDSDQRIVEAAARLMTYRSIPGTEEYLIAILEQGKLRNPVPIAETLAEVATTKRAVDALLPHVLKDDAAEFSQRTGYTFRKLIEHPDPEVAQPVRKALYNYTLRFEKQRYDQILVDHLAKSAGSDAIPVLEDILKNASDKVSRVYAAEALARLQPEKAVDLLVERIEREAWGYIVNLLRRHVTEADFDRVIPVLAEVFRKSGTQFNEDVVRMCFLELGRRGEQFVVGHIDEFNDNARMWAAWKLEQKDLFAALTEFRAAGVIQTMPEKLIEKMQEYNLKNGAGSLDISDPDTLVAALGWEGIVMMFDVETSTIPCDHDRLILWFANATNGQFSPQWPIQFWYRENEKDYDGPYTIQFVYKNRLFRIGAENYGDWYDVDAVARLMNFALETVGQPQRFVTLDSNGQIACFVFADPGAFLPIARKYRLPLSDDASKAMSKGIEYERRVIGK